MQYPHKRGRPVYLDHSDYDGLLPSARVVVDVADGKCVDCPRVLDLHPFISRPEILLAIHPGRDDDTTALVALPRPKLPLLQPVQEPAYRHPRGPVVLENSL